MQTQQISDIVNKHIPESQIHRTEIEISDINKQVDKLVIIFKPTAPVNLTCVGAILEDLTNLTVEDEYGDLTECKIEYTTFHEEPDNDEDMFQAVTYTINIDS